jgi:hypothetical protein
MRKAYTKGECNVPKKFVVDLSTWNEAEHPPSVAFTVHPNPSGSIAIVYKVRHCSNAECAMIEKTTDIRDTLTAGVRSNCTCIRKYRSICSNVARKLNVTNHFSLINDADSSKHEPEMGQQCICYG